MQDLGQGQLGRVHSEVHEDINSLDDSSGNPDELTKEMQATIEQLRKMEKDIAASKPSEVEGKVANMDNMKTYYTNFEETATDMCEAMDFMLQESRKEVRAGQLQKRYSVSTVVGQLAQGGWGKTASRVMGAQLHNQDFSSTVAINPNKLDHRVVTIFDVANEDACAGAKALHEEVMKTIEAAGIHRRVTFSW